MENRDYTFELSLSLLNHLGRNLYRNFVTVLGEAISNAWDADAKNVWIYIDRDNKKFIIRDDGDGMTSDDFQNKFLTVGYSKRKDYGMVSSKSGRPYIGAKGIGKLALLSCSEIISIISKTQNTKYTGGVINNTGLTKAIDDNLKPKEYSLGQIDLNIFDKYIDNHHKGTIIVFDELKEDIKNTIPHLKKLIALYFRFSLVDNGFNIFVNDEQVSLNDLKDLSENTEFLWNINEIDDPFLATLLKIKNEPIDIKSKLSINGFITTVEKPRYLKIAGTEEKVGIDLFVNGRLRERDMLKHLPDFSTRHIASYLYGQIHFDELDSDGDDRFTSSREGIISGEPKYNLLIEELKNEILTNIADKWDELRLDRGEDGDDDNPRKNLKERRARSLYNLSSKDYAGSGNPKVDNWIKELQPDAEFNIPSYVDCFLSENLIRKYAKNKPITLTDKETSISSEWRRVENLHKATANLNINIREIDDDLNLLDMNDLANLVDPQRGGINCLASDAKPYRPIRNALMHTSLLTKEAKQRLNSVYDNIKAKIKILLNLNP
jgi:hypothetical protein